MYTDVYKNLKSYQKKYLKKVLKSYKSLYTDDSFSLRKPFFFAHINTILVFASQKTQTKTLFFFSFLYILL